MKQNLIFQLLISIFLIQKSNAQLFFPTDKSPIYNVADAEKYLFSTQTEFTNNKISLRLKHFNQTHFSAHYTFELNYLNFPIYNSTIKINTDKQGNILSIKKENTDTNNLPQTNDLFRSSNELNQIHFQNIIGPDFPIQKKIYKIDTRNNPPHLICEINSWSKTHDETFLMNTQGEIIEQYDNCRYYKIDTIIHAKIFNPDPLTSLNLLYGAPYIDGNDSNLAWFAPAYQQKTILATFDTTSGEFLLENKWVKIVDFDTPNILPSTQTNPNFFYGRNEPGFEDVNVLYHITQFHDYISSIGYDSLMQMGITADTHGMGGFADNSKFSRNGGFPTLDFGIGGVDDAEDADVIIHEYSHALSWSANANDNFSNDRSALDEGLGDYFATSYSRSINPFRWEHVYSWDGNNEFWAGRVANTPTNYPNGGNIYARGEIWNTAMSNIWTDLGAIITDKLMLEAMHFFTNNTGLPEAAMYVLQADTVLFNGQHTNTICNRFSQKNILDANCQPTQLQNTTQQNHSIQINNTYGFTFLNENIEIEFPNNQSGEYSILDLTSKKVEQQKFNNEHHLSINGNNLNPGFYILQIQYGNQQAQQKIFKQ